MSEKSGALSRWTNFEILPNVQDVVSIFSVVIIIDSEIATFLYLTLSMILFQNQSKF